MEDKERFQLFYGPYEMPRLRYKAWTRCEIRGKVRAGKISGGRLPWPTVYPTKSLIVCGGLVQALKVESSQAIAYHWGVTVHTVSRWKRLLDVKGTNPGTLRLLEKWRAELQRLRKNPELAARAAKHIPTKQILRRSHPTPALIRSLEKRGFFERAWTQRELKLLGTMPDSDVAQRTGRTAQAVASRRATLGIPNPAPQTRPWTSADHKLLGKFPDDEVARRTGRTAAAVEARRETYKIPRANPKIRDWTPEEDALLGTMPDAELAKKLGRSVRGVRSRCVAKRILLVPTPRRFTPSELELLGTMPDADLAKLLGRSVSVIAVYRRSRGIPPKSGKSGGKPWTAEELALLGKLTDEEIARLTGRTLLSVRTARFDRGIPSPDPKRIFWTPRQLELLASNRTSAELARLTNRTPVAVSMKRRKLGLPNPRPKRPVRQT